jgi:hypothetical protein
MYSSVFLIILIVILISIGCNIFKCNTSDIEVFSPFFHAPPMPLDQGDSREERTPTDEEVGEVEEEDESSGSDVHSEYDESSSSEVELTGAVVTKE